MKVFRKLVFVCLLIVLCACGFWLGIRFAGGGFRQVETSRMEKCLKLYQAYRQTQDQQKLARELEAIGFTPIDFQRIIDRFIYYRTRKSSLDQAFRLLQAFRLGYDFEPVQVVEVSGFASGSFKLDAEIIAVFEQKPELVENAFEG